MCVQFLLSKEYLQSKINKKITNVQERLMIQYFR